VDGVEELHAIAKVEELVPSLVTAKLEELDTDSCSLFEQHLDTPPRNQPRNLRCGCRFGTLLPRASHRNTPTSINISPFHRGSFVTFFLTPKQNTNKKYSTKASLIHSPPGKRKRRRPQTPPEHLSSEEELTETMKAIKRGRLARDSFGKRIRGPEI
jgi:hypothetical protein